MNRFFHRIKRACALLMAVIILSSFAVPVSAFDDLSEVVNVTDYGNCETSSAPENLPLDISEAPEDEPDADLSAPQQPNGDTGEEEDPSNPPDDLSGPPNQDTGKEPEPGRGEDLPTGPDQELPNESTVGMSGLDPPEGFSFEVVYGGGGTGRRMARASSTMYMEKLPGLTHYFPFNSTSIYNAYKFYTADGQTAFCVEPARFNSTNGTVVTGSQTYGSLSSKQQAEIAKAIAACDGHSNNERYFATQAIIWEIASGQSPRSGSVYKAVITPNAGKLGSYYEEIRSEMESSGEIPSFMNPDPNDPAIHKMEESSGSWSIDLTNTNSKVTLNASDFTSRAPFRYSVSGNTLTVESGSEPDEDSFVEWHSGSGESGLIFWNSSQQTKASFDETKGIPADGYMAFSSDFIPPPPDTPEIPKEDPALGYLTIVKYDGDTNLPLGGAIFKVECDGYINDAVEVPYGGKTIVIPIPEGQTQVDVTVTEVTAPSGYVMDSTPKTVTVTANETVNIVEVGFVNYPEACSLEIYKHETGNKGVALEGASFRIRYADPNVSAQTWTETTDGSGKIHIDLPAAGALIVEELSAPAGYVMNAKNTYDVTVMRGEQKVLDVPNDKRAQLIVVKKDAQSGQYYTIVEAQPPHYIEVKADQDTEIVIKNKAKPSLRIIKTDSVTEQPMQGVTFEISVKQGATLGEYRTDANGEIFLPNIEPNLYVIRETKTLDGYLMDTQTKEALVEWGKTTEIEFTNTPKNPLLIYKVDFHTGEPLAGATFLVEKVNGEHVGEYITGRNGYATVTGIEPGLYVVKEVKPPLNYILDETPKTVELKYDEPAIVQFEDKAMSGLHIKKIDSLTKEPMEGVSFRVSEKDGHTIGEFKTDAQGAILIPNLQPGWYTIRETDTLEGYILDKTPRDVEFVWGQLITVEFTNDRKAELLVKKVDADTGEPLANAKFRLETVGGEFLGEYKTDRTGFFSVDGLHVDYIAVREIESPDGYLLDNAPHTVKVEANKPSVLELSNKKLSPVQIKKVDSETGAPLTGALFRVTKANGELIGEYTSGTDGFINVPELTPGFYIVSELRSPEGYLQDQTPKTIEVKVNVPTLVEFPNKQMPGLRVEKIDKVTGLPVGGAKFKVVRANGEVIGEFTTNTAGFFMVTDIDLNHQSVTVYETQAAKGYIRNFPLSPTRGGAWFTVAFLQFRGATTF